jgi:hypothetical protein
VKVTARGWSRDLGPSVLVSDTELAKTGKIINDKGSWSWPNECPAIVLDCGREGETADLLHLLFVALAGEKLANNNNMYLQTLQLLARDG